MNPGQFSWSTNAAEHWFVFSFQQKKRVILKLSAFVSAGVFNGKIMRIHLIDGHRIDIECEDFNQAQAAVDELWNTLCAVVEKTPGGKRVT